MLIWMNVNTGLSQKWHFYTQQRWRCWHVDKKKMWWTLKKTVYSKKQGHRRDLCWVPLHCMCECECMSVNGLVIKPCTTESNEFIFWTVLLPNFDYSLQSCTKQSNLFYAVDENVHSFAFSFAKFLKTHLKCMCHYRLTRMWNRNQSKTLIM